MLAVYRELVREGGGAEREWETPGGRGQYQSHLNPCSHLRVDVRIRFVQLYIEKLTGLITGVL